MADRPGFNLADVPSVLKSLVDVVSRITGMGDVKPIKALTGELKSDDGWRVVGASGNPAFAGAWANASGALAFCKDENGQVYLRGGVTNPGLIVLPDTIFTLPDGYWPHTTAIFAVNANNAFGSIQVQSDGRVQLVVGSITIVFVDPVSFFEVNSAPGQVRDAVNAARAKENELITRLQED